MSSDYPFPAPDRLEIPQEHWQAMLAHIRACLPEEGCGLLGGTLQGSTARAAVMLPVPNELHSPVRFRMDPVRQLEAFYQLEAQGLELVAIFHSHPSGPAVPSPTDLAEFAYPGTLTLIWSRRAPEGDWLLRGFRIAAGQAVEMDLQIINNGAG